QNSTNLPSLVAKQHVAFFLQILHRTSGWSNRGSDLAVNDSLISLVISTSLISITYKLPVFN
ncbi:MAG: hypothetical protein ACJ71H_09640, partial [Nitrososphaeraceae archaeon]